MFHHIYRSNIGVLGHGQHAFQRYSSSKPKAKGGASLASNVISKLIHQPQDARSLLWPVKNPLNDGAPSTTIRYKSDATTDRQPCSHQGCSSYVYRRGLCYKHAYPCTIDGCQKQAQVGGYCKEHAKELNPTLHKRILSQRKRCKVKECNKHAQVAGYCIGHAKKHNKDAYDEYVANTSCKVDDCDKQAQVGEYCSEHAKENDSSGHKRQLSRRKRCKFVGCEKYAVAGGYCAKHAQLNAVEASQIDTIMMLIISWVRR